MKSNRPRRSCSTVAIVMLLVSACSLSRKDLNIPQDTITYLPRDVTLAFLGTLKYGSKGSPLQACIFADRGVGFWYPVDSTYPPGARSYVELRVTNVSGYGVYLRPVGGHKLWCVVDINVNARHISGQSELSCIRKTVAALASLARSSTGY